MHGTSDGNFIELNGIIYLNRNDRNDKAKSKGVTIEVLKGGSNVMWFPEGIWNLSPNLPVLPMPFGIIEVAIKAGAIIVPVAIEQYEKEFWINVGRNFYLDTYRKNFTDETELKLASIADLRDTMATLKWEIWESRPIRKRKTIPDDFFDIFVNARLKEWHGFTYSDVRAREFHPKETVIQK